MARGVRGTGKPRNRKPDGPSIEPYAIQVAKRGGVNGAVPMERSGGAAFPIGEHVSPPEFFDDVAKSEWRRIATLQGQFAERGLSWITEFDVALLSAYCVAWSVWVRSAKEVLNLVDGRMTEVNDKGLAVERIELRIERESKKHLIATAKELGLSSMVRSRIQAQMIAGSRSLEQDDDHLLS